MIRNFLLAGATSLVLAGAAHAQTVATPAEPAAAPATTAPVAPTSPTTAPATSATAPVAAPATSAAVDLGVQPLADVPAPSYVVWTWQGNAFEIASAKVALRKATRSEVKAYAQSMLTVHEAMQKSLEASLTNPTRVFTKPGTELQPADAAALAALEKAPAAGFDTLYLTQRQAAHRKAWAIEKGFANTGQDAALKTLATANVPMIEQHYAKVVSLAPGGQPGR